MISMVKQEWQHFLFVATSKEFYRELDFLDLNQFA